MFKQLEQKEEKSHHQNQNLSNILAEQHIAKCKYEQE